MLSRYVKVNFEISKALIAVIGNEKLTLSNAYQVSTCVKDYYQINSEDLIFCSNKTESKNMDLKEVIVILTGKNKSQLSEVSYQNNKVHKTSLLENRKDVIFKSAINAFSSIVASLSTKH